MTKLLNSRDLIATAGTFDVPVTFIDVLGLSHVIVCMNQEHYVKAQKMDHYYSGGGVLLLNLHGVMPAKIFFTLLHIF